MAMLAVVSVLAAVCAPAHARGIQTRANQCYGDLGCFTSDNVMPLPDAPDHIRTTFRLYNRGSSNSYDLEAVGFKSHLSAWLGHFDVHKKTKVITHGFVDNGAKPWVVQMKSELLKKGDFNVIVTDWGHGSLTDYPKAVANTYVVGAQLAGLLSELHAHHGLQYADVHLIGHSLGAQISGHVGGRVQGLGRITGLDPADPGFTGKTTDNRLDASDAKFVDVIHTDGSKFNLVSGFGMDVAVGHLDFYPNGGEHQPGCEEKPVAGAIGSLTHLDLSGVKQAVTCSHSRSHELFTESINSACKFYAHLCPSGDSFEAGSCLGCPTGGCPRMGYDAELSSGIKGSFYLSTSGATPYCGHEYFVDVVMSDQMLHTYGEFMITLVGTKGHSEPLKFESLMHALDHGAEEKHVISTHVDIGNVTSVQLQFVKARGVHGALAAPYVKVHSVLVVPAEDASHRSKFCANDAHFNAGQTVAISSHTGC